MNDKMITVNSRLKATLLELGYILSIGLLTGAIGIGVSRWSSYQSFEPLKVGAKMQLERIGQWRGDTVVLATSASCEYCRQSLGFHAALIKRAHELGRRIVVLVSKQGAAPEQIVNSLGVNDSIVHVDLRKTGISGTPTIAAVDQTGMITGLWVGLMNDSQERTLLGRLEGSHTLTEIAR
jgi:hypothetical protein